MSDKALSHYLKLHPEITEIVFCYDNDADGKLADGTPHNHGQQQFVVHDMRNFSHFTDVVLDRPAFGVYL